MPRLAGDIVLPDQRFADDRHLYCPTCAQAASWVRDAAEAWEWTERGGALVDYLEHPSGALVEGILLIGREVKAVQADVMEDMRHGRR